MTNRYRYAHLIFLSSGNDGMTNLPLDDQILVRPLSFFVGKGDPFFPLKTSAYILFLIPPRIIYLDLSFPITFCLSTLTTYITKTTIFTFIHFEIANKSPFILSSTIIFEDDWTFCRTNICILFFKIQPIFHLKRILFKLLFLFLVIISMSNQWRFS